MGRMQPQVSDTDEATERVHLDLLRRSSPGRRLGLALYRALNSPDAANKWTAMLEPRYVLELARLLNKTGQEEAAREEYERFLELWKNADPGHPELAEARAYVAR